MKGSVDLRDACIGRYQQQVLLSISKIGQGIALIVNVIYFPEPCPCIQGIVYDIRDFIAGLVVIEVVGSEDGCDKKLVSVPADALDRFLDARIVPEGSYGCPYRSHRNTVA